MCDVLGLARSLEEVDLNDALCLVIQLGKGGFVSDFEGVKGIF